MTDLAALPPFPGFRDEAFAFLRGLKENNRRDWFKARKEVYEDELKGPLECLIADAARRMREENLPLTGNPTESRFRIYRDVRSTDDKRPYKTHVSALLTRTGAKSENGVVYIHIEPGGSFLAAGFYRPRAAYLRPVREAMLRDPEAFRDMLQAMEANGLPVTPDGNTLTGMPQGFAEHRSSEIEEHLRWKTYLVRRDVEDEATQTPGFTEDVVQMARDSRPLLRYVWAAQP